MPRIKKSISAIKMLSDEEKREIDSYLTANPDIKKKMDELKKVFAKHFAFSQEEIKLYIYNICKTKTRETIEQLNYLYEEFAKNDVSEFDHESRCARARTVVDDSIDLFLNDNKGISAEFVEILEQAKALNIDPFDLAIKTNMRTASVEKFSDAIEALYQTKYYDYNTGKEEELFTKDEVKGLIEQCASLACKANSEAIQGILNHLNGLFYDKTKKAYIYDVREIIKTAPSLLLASPKDVEMAISLIQEFKNLSKEEMLYRIKVSPTILAVNLEKVFMFDEILATSIKSIVKTKPYKELTSEQKQNNYAHNVADRFAFNINHLTQIEKIKLEDLKATSQILTKYLGADNAITCMQNMSVLSADPEFLEFLLASMVKEEEVSKINLRQFFVESPHRALTRVEMNGAETSNKDSEASAPEFSRGKKEEIIIKDFPSIFVTDTDFENIKKRVGGRKLGLTQQLLDKMKKLEEERQARIAQELEEQQKRIAEARRLKKEEEKEKKRIAKQQEKDRARFRQYQPTTVPVQEVKKEELDIEEVRRSRKEKALAKLSSYQTPPYTSIRDAFRTVYEPIMKGFEANGFYPKSLPKFHKMVSAYESLFDGQVRSLALHDEIMELSTRLHNMLFSDELNHKKDILSAITQPTSNGQLVGEEICDKLCKLVLDCKGNDSYTNDAVRHLSNACDRKNQSAFTALPQVKKNMFLKHELLCDCFREYALKADDLADNFFGKDFAQDFYNSNTQTYITNLANYLTEPLSPQAYNCFEMSIYVIDYFEAILKEFNEKKLLMTEKELRQMKLLSLPNTVNIEALKAINTADDNSVTINQTACENYGVPPFLVKRFCDTMNKAYEVSQRAAGMQVDFNRETEEMYIYYNDKDNGKYYIQVQKGDPDYSGAPAMVYFPDLATAPPCAESSHEDE